MSKSKNSSRSRRGLMVVLSSPSGAGKTTISRELLKKDKGLVMSISVTTRPQRPNEVQRRDYDFIDEGHFERMIAGGQLLEHATVYGYRYGTPEGPVRAALGDGQDIIFDVDWQGARRLRKYVLADTVSIFVLPPSIDALEHRLRTRGQDSHEVMESRMERAHGEMSHWDEFDYVVINDEIDDTLSKIREILSVERLKRHRQVGLGDFVRQLGEAT